MMTADGMYEISIQVVAEEVVMGGDVGVVTLTGEHDGRRAVECAVVSECRPRLEPNWTGRATWLRNL